MEQRSPVKQEQQENVHLPLAPIVTGDLQANPECSTPSDLPGHPEEVNEEQKGEGIAAGESGEERSAEQQAIGPATAPEVTSVPPPLRLVTLSFAVAAGLVSVSVMASAPPAALPICAAEGTSAEAAAPKEAAAEAAGAEPSPPEGLTAGEAEGAGAEALQPPPPPPKLRGSRCIRGSIRGSSSIRGSTFSWPITRGRSRRPWSKSSGADGSD